MNTRDSESKPHSSRSSYSDNAEFWIRIIRDGLDPYRRDLTDTALLEAVGACDGLTVLDAGCGEGYMCRMFAERGATVIGVDTCAELITEATDTARSTGLDIIHAVAPVHELPVDPQTVDVVVCNHVLNDLDDIEPAFDEFARVLRPAGRIVLMMLHPCFYQPRADRTSDSSQVNVTEYFAGRIDEQRFNVGGITSPAPVQIHMRSLENITKALTQKGFVLTSLTEPHPTQAQMAADSWWADNFNRPLFMLVTASRCHPPVGGAPARQ